MLEPTQPELVRIVNTERPAMPAVETYAERVEHRDRLIEKLNVLLEQIRTFENERVKRDFNFMRGIARERPADFTLYVEANRLRSQANQLINQINNLRPVGTHMIRTLHENMPGAQELARLGTLKAVDDLRQNAGFTKARSAILGQLSQQLTQYAASPEDGGKFLSVENAPRQVEHLVNEDWKPLEQAWQALGIDQDAEHNSTDTSEHATQSFRNMRERVRKCMNTYPKIKTDVARLKTQMHAEGEAIRYVYYAEPGTVQKMIESERIKQLIELPADEQTAKRKSKGSLHKITKERRTVEQALGWVEEQPVYHLVVETDVDERLSVGPAHNYGFVGFVLNIDSLGTAPTFTEGDSLNPDPLPVIYPKERGGDAVRQREIIREHVPLAKAILHLAQTMPRFGFGPPDPALDMLCYVEAQVGRVSGKDIFRAVTEVTIHQNVLDLFLHRANKSKKTMWEENFTSLKNWCQQRNIPIRII